MNRVLLLFTLAIIVSLSCFAQGDFRPGYLIKANGDSVSGYVAYRGNKSNYKSCLFRESKKGKNVRYGPSELKAYGIVDDRRFESRCIDIDSSHSDLCFIEIIIKGPVSLFSHRNTYFLEKDSLVKLPKSKSVTVETTNGSYKKEDKRFVGILNYMLSDCNVMGPKVKYQERYLTGIIYHYNECKGHPGIDFKGKKPWAKVNFQIFVSETISKLRVDGYSKNTFNTSYSPTGGIGLDFFFPRSSDKIFFSIEGWYVKNVFQGYGETIEPARTIRTDFFLNTSSFKFPIGIKYNFLHPDHTPYLKGGFVQYVPMNPTWSSVKETEDSNDVVYTESSSHTLQKKLPMGIWLGVGYSKRITNGLNGFIEFRIERNNGYTGSDAQASSSSTNINLIIGLRH